MATTMNTFSHTAPSYKLPFSHKPGFLGWIPGTNCALRAFPAACMLYTWGERGLELLKKIDFVDLGVPSKWTCLFDSVHRRVQVEGVGKSGFFRYRIEACEEGLVFRSLKGELRCTIDNKEVRLKKKEPYFIFKRPFVLQPLSRLDLGINKSPHWYGVTGRSDIVEIIQHWYHIATPSAVPSLSSRSLLGLVVEALQQGKKESVLEKLYDFYRAGMTDFFVPKREDDLFLGYDLPLFETPVEELHGIITACIRSLFLQEQKGKILLLPCLPKSIPSGRLFRERLASGHMIDMEWRKGKMRRLWLYAAKDDAIDFVTKPSKKCCVRRGSLRAKKEPHLFRDALEVRANTFYLLDNFEETCR